MTKKEVHTKVKELVEVQIPDVMNLILSSKDITAVDKAVYLSLVNMSLHHLRLLQVRLE